MERQLSASQGQLDLADAIQLARRLYLLGRRLQVPGEPGWILWDLSSVFPRRACKAVSRPHTRTSDTDRQASQEVLSRLFQRLCSAVSCDTHRARPTTTSSGATSPTRSMTSLSAA
jgi:hypothetical protein